MADKKVFVNPEKHERAKLIVSLLTGKSSPRDSYEVERTAHYSRVAQTQGIDLKDEDGAVEAFYIALGGLIRTEAEQKVADARKKEAQEKGKKDKMGLRG